MSEPDQALQLPYQLVMAVQKGCVDAVEKNQSSQINFFVTREGKQVPVVIFVTVNLAAQELLMSQAKPLPDEALDKDMHKAMAEPEC